MIAEHEAMASPARGRGPRSAMESMAKPSDSRPLTVRESYEVLCGRITSLRDIMFELESRLSPVLLPEMTGVPDAVKESIPSPCGCEIANSLLIKADELSALESLVKKMLARCDI